MSIRLEAQGIIFTNEELFRQKVCGHCRNREVCENWEFLTSRTLYSNTNLRTRQPLKAANGTLEVYRCSSYEEVEP